MKTHFLRIPKISLSKNKKPLTFKVMSRNPLFYQGQAAVEIALTLPIFLFIVMGLIDFSFRFYLQLGLTDIATESAQYGATRNEALGYPAGVFYDPQNPYDFTPTESQIKTYVSSKIGRLPLDASKLVVTVNTNDTLTSGTFTGKAVRVTLTYPLEPLTPLLNHLSSSWQVIGEGKITKKE